MQFFAKAGKDGLFGEGKTILNGLRCALAIIRGKNIFNFGFQESLRTFLKPIFTGGVIEESGRGSKKQNAQVPKNLCVMAGVVSFELTARGFGDRCSTS